jgi:tetratricopeptide (TPR) repeat protein
MALLYAAIVHNFRREPKDAIRNAAKAQTLVAEHRLAAFVDPRVLQAAALAEQGQALEAFALIQKANVDDKGSIGPIARQSYTLGVLSVILDQIGEGAKALHTVDHALSLAEKSQAQWWDAEVYRIKGALPLSRKESASSEACFRRSIEIAQQQGARSIELRAATDLARLCAIMANASKLGTSFRQSTTGSPRA